MSEGLPPPAQPTVNFLEKYKGGAKVIGVVQPLLYQLGLSGNNQWKDKIAGKNRTAIIDYCTARPNLNKAFSRLGEVLRKHEADIPQRAFIDYIKDQTVKSVQKQADGGSLEKEIPLDEDLAWGIRRAAVLIEERNRAERVKKRTYAGVFATGIAAIAFGARYWLEPVRPVVSPSPENRPALETPVPSPVVEMTSPTLPAPEATTTPDPQEVASLQWMDIKHRYGIDPTEGSEVKSALLLGSRVALPSDIVKGEYGDFEKDIIAFLTEHDVLKKTDKVEYMPGEPTEMYVQVTRENGVVKVVVYGRGIRGYQANQFIYDLRAGTCTAVADEPGGNNSGIPDKNGNYIENQLTFNPKSPQPCIAKVSARSEVIVGFVPDTSAPDGIGVLATIVK